VFGYQWLGVIYILNSFPHTNGRGDCASLTPTCASAFNSTISLAPSSEVDIESGVWKEILYDAYTQVNPLLLPSATIWRWPSTFGGISKGHDGAVAIALGAMEVVNRQETVTGPKLAEMIRTVSGKLIDSSFVLSHTCRSIYYALCTLVSRCPLKEVPDL